MKHFVAHTLIFVAAQTIFKALGYSWPWEVLHGDAQVGDALHTISGEGWWSNTSRIWAIVWAVDAVLTVGGTAFRWLQPTPR